MTSSGVGERVTRVDQMEAMLKRLEEEGRRLEQSEGLTGELVEKLKSTPSGEGRNTVVEVAKFLRRLKQFPSLEEAYTAQSQMNAQTAAIKRETVQVRSHTEELNEELGRLRAQYELMLENRRRLDQLKKS